MAWFVGVPGGGTRVVGIAGLHPAGSSDAMQDAVHGLGKSAQLTESGAGHDRQFAITWQSRGG